VFIYEPTFFLFFLFSISSRSQFADIYLQCTDSLTSRHEYSREGVPPIKPVHLPRGKAQHCCGGKLGSIVFDRLELDTTNFLLELCVDLAGMQRKRLDLRVFFRSSGSMEIAQIDANSHNSPMEINSMSRLRAYFEMQ
jgi:hypothetical protein